MPVEPEVVDSKFFNISFVHILIFFLIFSFVLGIYVFVIYLKKRDREEKTKEGVVLEVKVPSVNEWEIGVAERMFANLHSISGLGKGVGKYLTVNNSVSFEIVGLPGEVRFFVYTPKKYVSLVEEQILGAYQDANIDVVEEYNIFADNCSVAFTTLELSSAEYYSIKVAEDFEGDPLGGVLSAFSKIGEKEGLLLQVVVSPADDGWKKKGEKFVNSVESNNQDPEKKKINVPQEKLQSISKKTSKVGFNTSIRVVSSAPTKEVAHMHLENVVGAFEQFSNPGLNSFKKKEVPKYLEEEFMYNVVYRRMPLKCKTVLNVEELAAVFHFPNKDIRVPNINWLLAKDAPVANWVSSEVNSKDTIWVGDNIFRGSRRKVCFKKEDRLRHTYILGQTGTGKSWLEARMVVQDIYNGDGVALIDPHGSLAEQVLESIPPERSEDVIYFNVADEKRPFGLNILDFYSEQHKHMIVNSFIDLLIAMFDPHNQGYVGANYQQSIRNAMLTAMSRKGSTLIEVVRMLTDERWVMEEWLQYVEDPLVKRYWTDQVAKTDQKLKSEQMGYFVSKFDKFVTNLTMRNILGQSESSFDCRKVMDEGKILIVNLSKGMIGDENMRLIGLLLVQKFVAAALSRQDIPEDERRPFFLYVDEFQNFTTNEFQSILSEARKYKLGLTVANQYIAQMPEEMRNAIFGNVGSLFIGRTGAEDAEYLAQQFEPVFNSTDIVNQSNIHYYVKLLCDGKYPPPFSLDPSFHPFGGSEFVLPAYPDLAKTIKEMSSSRYGRDVNVVKEEIDRRSNLSPSDD